MDFVLADLIVIGLMLKLDVVFSSQSAVDTVLSTTHTHPLYCVKCGFNAAFLAF
jgi:hypothetical protein